ncbi:UDP-glucose 4-epimerase-like isoform X2 [Tachypleus tridentatus]|uniref:UDP-glucose 4-epimerase-like isoform X2 n=1 Tax=Tachypleus tridentatus TaxID=6853 RepID=UPI003FD5393D
MTSKKTVFVTGGAGFIGSHTVVELLNADYEVIVIDNFVNAVHGSDGQAPSLLRAQQITGKKLTFYQCDLLNKDDLSTIFRKHKIDFVIHFAAMKAVGESMQKPLFYYKNNIVSSINLMEVMSENGVYNLVFSSSCVVYGNPQYLPIDESHPTGNVSSVYGRTKYALEQMFEDICRAEKKWNVICLRYFNPVGAHPSGLVGEDPTRAFTNLMPIIGEVATGRRAELVIFGGDYDSVDGTGIRDYIHVMDLAAGHVAALKKFTENPRYKFLLVSVAPPQLWIKVWSCWTEVQDLTLIRGLQAVTINVWYVEVLSREHLGPIKPLIRPCLSILLCLAYMNHRLQNRGQRPHLLHRL